MKILHVIPSMKNGGAQKLLVDLIPLMIEAGHKTDLLLFDSSNAPLLSSLGRKDVKIIDLGFSRPDTPFVVTRLYRHLQGYDIVHTHSIWAQLYVSATSRFLPLTMVTTEHNTHNRRRDHKWFAPVDRWMYAPYRKIISISAATERNLRQWTAGKLDSSVFTTISNGINLSDFSKPYAPHPEFNFPGMLPIVMVSRFSKQKDQDTLVRALPHIDSRAFAVFAGAGERLEEVKNLAKATGVADRCIFLGNRTDIPEIVRAARIGVQSSNWEGFGLTAVEFMAAGKPVVASNVEGLSQVVENAGLLFTRGNELELAAKINGILHNDSEYERLSSLSFQRAKEYDIREMCRKYLDVYAEVLSSGK